MFVGENLALLDFIDIMDNEELLLNGEYVVLAIDNSIDDVSDNQVLKIICRPQSPFFPLIKVSLQFLIKGISSLKPLILKI